MRNGILNSAIPRPSLQLLFSPFYRNVAKTSYIPFKPMRYKRYQHNSPTKIRVITQTRCRNLFAKRRRRSRQLLTWSLEMAYSVNSNLTSQNASMGSSSCVILFSFTVLS